MSKTAKRGTKKAAKPAKAPARTSAKKAKKTNLKKAGEITNIVVTVLAFLVGVALLGLLVWAAVKICMGLLPGVF